MPKKNLKNVNCRNQTKSNYFITTALSRQAVINLYCEKP